MNDLFIGDLTDRVTLDIAKPMVVKLARDRISRNRPTSGEELILKILVQLEEVTISILTDRTEKSKQYISRILTRLIELKLITVRRDGKNKYYTPLLDATIAYGNN